MLIYTEDPNSNTEKIYEVELQEFGKNIEKFVNTYANNIALTSPEKDRAILQSLLRISQAIKNKEYDKLFQDTSIIERTTTTFSNHDVPF